MKTHVKHSGLWVKRSDVWEAGVLNVRMVTKCLERSQEWFGWSGSAQRVRSEFAESEYAQVECGSEMVVALASSSSGVGAVRFGKSNKIVQSLLKHRTPEGFLDQFFRISNEWPASYDNLSWRSYEWGLILNTKQALALIDLPSPYNKTAKAYEKIEYEVFTFDLGFEVSEWRDAMNRGMAVEYVGEDMSVSAVLQMEKYRNNASSKLRETRYIDVVKLLWPTFPGSERSKRWLCGLSSIMFCNIVLWVGFSSDPKEAVEWIDTNCAGTPECVFTKIAKARAVQVNQNPHSSKSLKSNEWTNLGDLSGRYVQPLGEAWGFDQLEESRAMLQNDVELLSYDKAKGAWTKDQFLRDLEEYMDHHYKPAAVARTTELNNAVSEFVDYLERPELYATPGSSKGLKISRGVSGTYRATKSTTVFLEEFNDYMAKEWDKDDLVVGSSVKPDRPKPRIIVPFPLEQTVLDTYLARGFEIIVSSNSRVVWRDSLRLSSNRKATALAATSADVKCLAYDWSQFERHHSVETWDLFIRKLVDYLLSVLVSAQVRGDVSRIATKVRTRYKNARMELLVDGIMHVIKNQGTNLSGSRFTSLFNGLMNDALNWIRDKNLARLGYEVPERLRWSQGDDVVEFCFSFDEMWRKITVFKKMGCKTNWSKLVADVGRTTFLKVEISGKVTGGLPRVVSSLTEHSPEGGEVMWSSHDKIRELVVKLANVHRRRECDPGDWRLESAILSKTISNLKGDPAFTNIPQELGGYGYQVWNWDGVSQVVEVKADMSDDRFQVPKKFRGLRWRVSRTVIEQSLKYGLEPTPYLKRERESKIATIESKEVKVWLKAKADARRFRLVRGRRGELIRPYKGGKVFQKVKETPPYEYGRRARPIEGRVSVDEISFVIDCCSGQGVRRLFLEALKKGLADGGALASEISSLGKRVGWGNALDLVQSGLPVGVRPCDIGWLTTATALVWDELKHISRLSMNRFKSTLVAEFNLLARQVPLITLWA